MKGDFVLEKNQSKEKKNPLLAFSAFIVDKRNLIFLLYIFALIFCMFSSSWVQVENDITKYLPEDTVTRRGLAVMDREFVTFATADIMISNVSYDRAEKLCDDIEEIKGVGSVKFDNTNKHFTGSSALLSVSFDDVEESEETKKAMDEIKELLKDYDSYISSSVGVSQDEALENDMRVIIVIVAVIILAVLLFTSKAYAEVIPLILTFLAAALLNKGTNFMLGKISFISNSVAIVLQLALAIDYAIILCHRFSEEREHLEAREAIITALSKAIVEISSSSLTTISGLLALFTMQFMIGRDLGMVLVKAIFLSLLSVFTLMPGLLLLMSGWIDKTKHKNLVPKINLVGKFDIKTKKTMPVIFLVLMVVGFFLSNMCPYCYGFNNLSTPRKDETQITRDKIASTFKKTSLVAIVLPSGNYKNEGAILNELEKYPEVDSTLGLSNTEALDGYMLTDEITPRQFSEIAEVDYEVAKLLYAAYAVQDEDYGEIVGNLDSYKLPLIDVFMFLHDQIDKKYVTLSDDLTSDINDLYDQLCDAKKQLESDNYSRMLVYLDLPEEGEKTFAFLDTIDSVVKKYYPEDTYVVGDSTSDRDLSLSFSRDNIIISILSALFVIIVLLFTFNSAGLPILLILVIQGSIWINFSFPYLQQKDLYFLGYLIVTSIQMGANIDYAIVISGRYNDLKKTMPLEEAAVEALNQSFPTIITSGAILAAAGTSIGLVTTNGVISAIGICIGRGTLISIFLVMCVLPQILMIGDKIIEKTSFTLTPPDIVQNKTGTVYLNGRVRGRVSGFVDANVHGLVKGDVNAIVEAGNIAEVKEGEDDEDEE